MLEHLRAMAVFAKTVEMGSFRAAARALGLSPSVVSHHIAQLEQNLEVALLYRTTRRLTLTEEGKEFFNAAREMVSAAERGVAEVSRDAKNPSGQLRVALPASLLNSTLMDDLAAFATTFPQVALSLHSSDTQVDIIRDGIDVAIRAGTLKDSALKSKKLFVFERALLAAPAYLARKPTPTHPRDVAGWDWIRLASRPANATFIGKGGRKVHIDFTARITVDTAHAMLPLARNAIGICMVPTTMAAVDLREGHLVEVLPSWRPEAPNVHAVWPANAPRSGLTMRLVGFLLARQ